MKALAHKKLTIDDVIALGKMLIEVADMYPIRYLTERDFFPLVVAYLTGRVPALAAEVSSGAGRIDFKLKGPNPTWLEIAVQPRELADKDDPAVLFSSNQGVRRLLASQNRSELKKLKTEPKGKTRFLLLVDLPGAHSLEVLKKGYREEAKKIGKGNPVRVVYVSRGQHMHFVAR